MALNTKHNFLPKPSQEGKPKGPDTINSCLKFVRDKAIELLNSDGGMFLSIGGEGIILVEIDEIRGIKFIGTSEFIPFRDMEFTSEPTTIGSQTVVKVEINDKYGSRGGLNYIIITNPSYV